VVAARAMCQQYIPIWAYVKPFLNDAFTPFAMTQQINVR
jgi:hypothetical protein